MSKVSVVSADYPIVTNLIKPSTRRIAGVAPTALLVWGCFLFTSPRMLGQGPIFPEATNVTVGSFPSSVALADFNGDHKLDLAVVNNGSNSVTVLLGNGMGGFAPAGGSPFSVGSGPVSVVIGDFNRDNKPDLAITNSNDATVTVLLGDGTGGFALASATPIAVPSPYAAVVGDFNRDGKPDLAVTSTENNTVTVLLGDGLGGFVPASGSPFAVGNDPVSVAIGDFNGDGKPDLAIANEIDNNITVLLGDGLGGFVPATGSPFAAGAGPFSVVAGDFNSDLKSDLAIANSSSSTVTVLLGDGSGGFSPAGGSPFPVGSTPFSLAVGDFNMDQKSDLAIANLGDGTVTVLLGDGVGGFTPDLSSGPVGAALESIATGDLNADGKPDLLVANAGRAAVTVLLNATKVTAGSITATRGTPQSATRLTAFPMALQATVADSGGAPVSGVTVTFLAPASGASGSFAGGVNSAATNASGVATSALFTANGTSGTYTVTASVGGVGTTASYLLTNLSTLPAASVTASNGTPQSANVLAVFYSRLQAVVRDANGTLLSGATVTFSAPPTGSSGWFAGAINVTTDGSGVATAPVFTANNVAGPYVVTATVAGAAIPATFSLTNVAANRVDPTVFPERLVFTYSLGTDANESATKFSVTTDNNSTFSVISAAPWLNVSPAAGATPATVVVKPNPAGLTVGNFATMLTFTFADNSTVMVPVSMRVLDVPSLVSAKASLSFTVQTGTPAVQTADLSIFALSRNVTVQVSSLTTSPVGGTWLAVGPASGTTALLLHIVVNPAGLPSGTYQGAISVSSGEAKNTPLVIPVTLTVTAPPPPPPAIAIASLNNCASLRPTSGAPNLIMCGFGTFPGCSAAQVSVDGRPTDVFYSSPTQINFLIPDRVSGRQSVPVQIECAGLSSQSVPLPIATFAPAVFTVAQNGAGQAAVINQDLSTAKPSPPGSIISVFVTGLGMFGPRGSSGWMELAAPISALIGSLPATVMYAGEAPGFTSGLQQINIRIPENAPSGAAIPLQITINGVNSQPGVTLAIQ